MNLNITNFMYLVIIIITFFVLYFLLSSCKESFVIANDVMTVKEINIPFSKSFNIDKMCKNNNKKYLGWKCYIKNNFSNNLVEKDNSFKGTTFQTYMENTPLMYDGIFKLK